jgi:hypothetical protein
MTVQSHGDNTAGSLSVVRLAREYIRGPVQLRLLVVRVVHGEHMAQILTR